MENITVIILLLFGITFLSILSNRFRFPFPIVLDWVWSRLSVGGVVLFNDYGFPITKGITQLVNEENGRQGRVVIHNINGNGIIVKTEV